MNSPSSAEEKQLLPKMLEQRLIPRIRDCGIKSTFIAASSWKAIQRADISLPQGMTVTQKPPLGKSIPGKRIRTHNNVIMEERRWPDDQLLSARAPKLCFIMEGAVAFRIADYELHCNPGHSILLPPGTPHPDGKLSVLDKTRMPHHHSEIFMILPRGSSLTCWSSQQNLNRQGHLSHKGITCSVPRSQAISLLYRLMGEAEHKQAHWREICGAFLYTMLMLLHRELQDLPVITTGSPREEMPDYTQIVHPIARAEKYIQENLQHPLLLEKVARYAYLSRTAFSQQFKEYTGKTFIQYINDYRYEVVCELLQGSELSIHHIGLQVGITERNLRLLVRKKCELSPTELRRQLRENSQK